MKKKILILGGTGMLGNMLCSYLSKKNELFDVTITARNLIEKTSSTKTILYDAEKQEIFDLNKFDWVINCIGIIKQRNVETTKKFYEINSIFPWKLLNKVNQTNKTKLIHISSDCVFKGDLEPNSVYQVTDIPDADDDYGYSKALGEPSGCIVLRTSIIGPSKKDSLGLFEWFRTTDQQVVQGYKHYWSGVTTLELSKLIESILIADYYPSRHTKNIYQVATEETISKLYLLHNINEIFNVGKIVSNQESEKFNHQIINRGLKSNSNSICSFQVRDILTQLKELKEWEDNNEKSKDIFYSLQ